MDRIQVNSTNIKSIGYDLQSAILEVEFISGDVCRYFDVPEHLYKNLMNSASKEEFLSEYIKYNYRYQKIS